MSEIIPEVGESSREGAKAQSQTPRTDAELQKNEGGSISFIFARQLERELTAALAERDAARDCLERLAREMKAEQNNDEYDDWIAIATGLEVRHE